MSTEIERVVGIIGHPHRGGADGPTGGKRPGLFDADGFEIPFRGATWDDRRRRSEERAGFRLLVTPERLRRPAVEEIGRYKERPLFGDVLSRRQIRRRVAPESGVPAAPRSRNHCYGWVESYFWPLSTGMLPFPWSCGTPTVTAPVHGLPSASLARKVIL
jgi:hypothetical protein